jgi:ATP-binding cassette subfamily B protein
LAASLTLLVVSIVVSSTSPLLLERVINDALPRHRTVELVVLCSAMIASGVLAAGVGVVQGALANRMGQRVVHELRIELYDRVQSMGLSFFASDANTEIQSRLVSDIGGISDILSLTAQAALAAAVGLTTAAVVMLVLSWPLALVSITLAVLLNVANQRFATRRNSLAAQRQDTVSAMMRMVAEDLSLPGVILGRTLGRSATQRSRFADASRQLSDLTYRQRLAGRAIMAWFNVTLACLPPIVYLLSGTVVHGISLGTAVVLATMQSRLTGPIQQLLSLSGTMQSSRAMFDRVFEYIDLDGSQDPHDTRAAADDLPAGVPSMALSDVRYLYPGKDVPAVTGATTCLPSRSFIAVVGHSGSGKSTLALLLAGLLAPSGGAIRLEYPAQTGPVSLRDAVTLVSQDTVLFNTSIRENLLFARDDASEADLHRVLEAASLTELVSRLPDGLDTPVGERGYQLSGGERQRLTLARALLSGGPVMVVDEATSALDGLTADEIYKQLHDISRQRTVVMVAHRLPRLASDDRVIVMAEGRIVEQGLHGELLGRDGPYHQFVAAQSIAGAT